MRINDFMGMARSYFDSNLTVLLRSPPGSGKSEISAYLPQLFSAQDGFEWGYGTAFLATYTPVDLLGFMVPGKMADGTRISEFTIPPWMQAQRKFGEEVRLLNSFKRGVLLVDEYDKAEPEVKRSSAELILHRRIGPWQLHDGIGIIVASNRKIDRSGSTKDYDFVINRRAEVDLQTDIVSWEDWAVKNVVNPLGITFAKKYPAVVFTDEVPKEQGPWCTPRSFVAGLRWLESYTDDAGAFLWQVGDVTSTGNRKQKGLITEGLLGIMGEGAALQLMTWIDMRTETPDFDTEIIADPDNCKIAAKPDAKMITAYECAHRATADNIDKVAIYINRMPKEYLTLFAVAVLKRDHTLLPTKPMRQMVKDNVALINMIGAAA